MPPQILAIDMDGTLVHPGGHISPRNRVALQRAHDAGVKVVIATGRRHNYAMKVLRTVDLPPETVVLSSNGTVARTVGGELLFRRPLSLQSARWLCAELGEFRNAFVLTFDLLGADGEDMPGALVMEELDDLHGSIRGWMEANAHFIRKVKPIEQILADGADGASPMLPIQAMLCGTMSRMKSAEDLLAAAPGHPVDLYRTEYPGRDLCILDILPPGCSKGTGLQKLMEAAGMEGGLMSIGDNWNDLPMLELADTPVLMANAPAALSRIAEERGWTVTSDHQEDGAAEAIEAALAL